MPLSVAQASELFHIAFLDLLSKRLEADRYVLKGGANLRYFFDSVRYSQDIDLDVEGIPAWRLNKKIDASRPPATPTRSGPRSSSATVRERANISSSRFRVAWSSPTHSAHPSSPTV